jgi:hypothetical protein
MKKLLLVSTFACLAFSMSAQFSIGLSVGANQTYWQWYIKSLETEIGSKPAFGNRVALLGEWQISPLIGLRAELGTQLKRSYSGQLEFPDMLSTAKRWENYREVDGTLLIQVSPIKKMRAIYLVGGASFGTFTEAWQTIKGEGPEFESEGRISNEISLEDKHIRSFIPFAEMGLGANIPIGERFSLKFEGRYQYDVAGYVDHPNVDAHVNTLMLTGGFLYRL